jgi:hypothetical protein
VSVAAEAGVEISAIASARTRAEERLGKSMARFHKAPGHGNCEDLFPDPQPGET